MLALFGGFLAACHGKSSPQLSADDARDVLIDRNWIDRMPEPTTDQLRVYRFVPSMGGGVFQDRALFKGTFELFMFRLSSPAGAAAEGLAGRVPQRTHVRARETTNSIEPGVPARSMRARLAVDVSRSHREIGG